MRRVIVMLLAAVLAGVSSGGVEARDLGPRPPGQFDFYVLSLSWATGFCDTASYPDPAECSNIKGFLLHGLWPELNGGDWPSNCSSQPLPQAERQRFWGIYASPTLIAHEWSKHGTCSGLQPGAYFELTRADVARVAIPGAYQVARRIPAGEVGALRRAFVAANPGMTPNGLHVATANGEVTELDICLTRGGAFRAC